MTATRPICRWCGKPLHWRTITIHLEEEWKDYHRDTDYSKYFYFGVAGRPQTMADCQKLTNNKIISLKRGTKLIDDVADPYGKQKVIDTGVQSFRIWDGENFDAIHGFFCSNACAMDLGKAAASPPFRLAGVGYHEAMRRIKQ